MSKSTNGDGVDTESRSSPALALDISPRRLHVIVAGLWLCLFISALDTTIITTALIKISSGFNALDRSAWLITTYLLTYNAFLLMSARLSDVWGLKTVLVGGNVFFLIFSMACGGAQTMVQLIVFRAFQGIGGSTLYSLVFVSIMKLITPEEMGFYTGIISSVFALANLLGPILGGVIADHTTWRWIFFINGPIVGISTVLLFLAMPGLKDSVSHRERFRKFDTVGGVLSVCWLIPLLFALQEGGAGFEWTSGVIIGTLVTGIVVLILFAAWEVWVSRRGEKDPVFPVQFLTRAPMALLLLSCFLLGIPFYAAIILLPQRFQSVHGTSASRAGILLLPLTLMSPVGSMIFSLLSGKSIVPAEYGLLISVSLVTVGTGLLSSLPTDHSIWSGIFGYEVVAGLGLGAAMPTYFILLYTSVEEKHTAVATGALNMMRTLGGCVGIAICSALHHSVLREKLPAHLTSFEISMVEDSAGYIASLSPEKQNAVGEISGQSYQRQFQVLTAFCGLNVLVVGLMTVVRWKRGLLGKMPERKEGNEFMKKAEDPEEAGQTEKDDRRGRGLGDDVDIEEDPREGEASKAR